MKQRRRISTKQLSAITQLAVDCGLALSVIVCFASGEPSLAVRLLFVLFFVFMQTQFQDLKGKLEPAEAAQEIQAHAGVQSETTAEIRD